MLPTTASTPADPARYPSTPQGAAIRSNTDHPVCAAHDHGLAAVLGDRNGLSTGSASTWRPTLGRQQGDLRPILSVFFDLVGQDSGRLAGEADRRAVGLSVGSTATKWAGSPRSGANGTGGFRDNRPGLVAQPRRADRRLSGRDCVDPPTSTADTAGWAQAERRRSTSSPCMTDSPSPISCPTNGKHNEANGENKPRRPPTTIGPGTAGWRAQPPTPDVRAAAGARQKTCSAADTAAVGGCAAAAGRG